jgi:hypothetical protein
VNKMKKFENTIKEEDAIISTRIIDPSEWKEFNNRMYEAGIELRAKEIGSQKSAYNVRVR